MCENPTTILYWTTYELWNYLNFCYKNIPILLPLTSRLINWNLKSTLNVFSWWPFVVLTFLKFSSYSHCFIIFPRRISRSDVWWVCSSQSLFRFVFLFHSFRNLLVWPPVSRILTILIGYNTILKYIYFCNH